jgi:molybdate transport system substrate-binding protein
MHFSDPRKVLAVVLAALLCAAVTARLPPAPAQEASQPLTIAAAADLQSAFMEIGQQFEQKTGRKVTFSFGATGSLVTQIENGAPFDLIAAANEQYVIRLEEKGLLVPGSRQAYAIGRIVVASNKKAGIAARDVKELLDPRIRKVAIANPEHAPYGAAAREALMKAGVWERLQPKLVLGENIRQTLQFIQTGNAEAGIVALSVARVPEVSYRLIDARLHAPLKQALAIIQGTPHEAAARAFIRFLQGPAGRSIMQRDGFQLPGKR